MKRNICSFLLFFTSVIVIPIQGFDPDTQFLDQTIMMGHIQFPRTVHRVPVIRMYYAGNKIKGEIDHDLKKTAFSLPCDRNSRTFYVVICSGEDLQRQAEKNLVHYHKLRPHAAYKFYRVDLITKPSKDPKRLYAQDREWQVRPVMIGSDRRLPDQAIIVCYNPDFIDGLDVTSPYEFPAIKIRSDIVSFVGSEEMFQQLSTEALLAAVDHDPFHASIKSDVRHHQQKTIIAMITP